MSESFAELLRRYRIGRRFTMAELAEESQIDPSYLSRIEAGERVPSLAVTEALVRALRLSGEEGAALLMASCDPVHPAHPVPVVVPEAIDTVARSLHEFLNDESVSELKRARVRQWVSLTLAMHRATGQADEERVA